MYGRQVLSELPEGRGEVMRGQERQRVLSKFQESWSCASRTEENGKEGLKEWERKALRPDS